MTSYLFASKYLYFEPSFHRKTFLSLKALSSPSPKFPMTFRHPASTLNSFTHITNVLVSAKYSSVYFGAVHCTSQVIWTKLMGLLPCRPDGDRSDSDHKKGKSQVGQGFRRVSLASHPAWVEETGRCVKKKGLGACSVAQALIPQ